MSEYCVVVAEGAHARIFTLEPSELPELESGPNLVERKSLADRRDGDGEASASHERESQRKFARRLAEEIGRMVRRNGFQHLVLCADKRTLGTLRPSLNGSMPGAIALHEVPKDLAHFNNRAIHEKLAQDGHLPRRQPRKAG